MKTLLLFLLLSTAAWGQDKTDTVPVTILVRISGKPWAFFHDGWEVRRKMVVGSVLYDYKKEPEYLPVYDYSHLLYLDSRKRPIRKEWVVYQTFKR